MSMASIARYMHISQTIDFKTEKEKYFHLPRKKKSRMARMAEQKSAVFSTIYSQHSMLMQ